MVFSWWAGMGHPRGFARPPAVLSRRAGGPGSVGLELLPSPPPPQPTLESDFFQEVAGLLE